MNKINERLGVPEGIEKEANKINSRNEKVIYKYKEFINFNENTNNQNKCKFYFKKTKLDIKSYFHPNGEIKIGDSIEWSGDYFDGYNPDGSFKNKQLSGVNKVSHFVNDGYHTSMILDNGKEFFLKNNRTSEYYSTGWTIAKK